jgi:hypothetical protein
MYRTHHNTQKAGLGLICILVAALLILAAPVAGQDSTIGFTNGNCINDMEIQSNYVWCATTGSLVRWNKADGTYRQFTEKDGLADIHLACVEKDAQGNLWLGTTKGVQRFDGATFTTFNTTNSGLVNNAVRAIAVAQNGVIWIGTSDGLSKFDGKTWTNYTTQNSSITSNNVTSVAVEKGGVVWLAHNEYQKLPAVSSFDGTTWKSFNRDNSGLTADYIIDVAVDNNNVKWFGTFLNLLSFDGKTWTEYPYLSVNDMTVDNKGVFWIAAGREGIVPAYSLSSYDGKSWTSYPLDTKLDHPILAFNNVRIDSDGKIWFVSKEYEGAYSLHSYDVTAMKTFHTEGPLSFDFSGIAIDSMNRKWFATKYGVSCFDGKSWVNRLITLTREDVGPNTNLESLNKFANVIKGIAVDRDNVVWVCDLLGSYAGSYDGRTWKLYTHSKDSSFLGGLTYSIVVDRNNVKWFAGLYIQSYDGKTWTNYQQYKTFSAWCGAVDNDNVKWFGTLKEGVWSFDGTTWTNYYTTNSPLKNWITGAAADQNNVKWFSSCESQSTNKAIIYSFDGKTWKTYGPEITGVQSTGLNLYVDRNNVLWLLQNPLISFDGKTWKTWPNLKAASMSSAIALDADGYMWIASNYGVGESGNLSAMKLSTGPTGVAEVTPMNFAIIGNYPNPFNPSTTISFTLPETGKASLAIYNVSGQKVRELVSSTLSAGKHSVVWDGCDMNGNNVSSGIYISRLTMKDKVTANRMLLIK